MKTTINNKLLSRNLFFSAVFFITVFFSDWYGGAFYFNRSFRIIKYILCVLVPFLTVRFNFRQERNLKFISKSTVIIMSSFVCFFILFNLLKVKQFSFDEMASLYHIAYALVCIFSVFAAATAVAKRETDDIGYARFYDDFFLGYLPMLVLLYFLFYANYRTQATQYTVNLVPFQGEIKTVLNDFSSLTVMRTLGNIAFYSTIALCASRFIKKHTALFSFLLPFALCILTELVQGLFSKGDADIDDVLLNGFGAIIGALIYRFVIQDLRRRELCSE